MRSSVSAMLKRITHTFMYVLDQDKAVDFYVGKLGMVINTDADLGNMRWLTVALPGDPELELALMVPGPPVHDDATVEQLRELIAKGAGTGVIFQTDDCRGTYERLKAEGVEFTQEPVERFYGTDCALRDPFGNPLRITQPPDGPVVVPSKEDLEASGMG
jgi:catechol 2,3-dioxygenase-like lactoylglutathione lyase family enzyme